MIIYLLVFVVIAFMLYTTYSQQRRAKRAQEQLQRMVKKGDEVLTVGGMFGTVRKVGDDFVVLEVADRTKVRFMRRAIREIVNEEEDVEEDEEEYVDDEYDEAEYDEEADEGDEAEGDEVYDEPTRATTRRRRSEATRTTTKPTRMKPTKPRRPNRGRRADRGLRCRRRGGRRARRRGTGARAADAAQGQLERRPCAARPVAGLAAGRSTGARREGICDALPPRPSPQGGGLACEPLRRARAAVRHARGEPRLCRVYGRRKEC